MKTTDPATSSSRLPDVPWDDVVRFVRQLSHDLRNHLNAAELQSAYLGEIATDPELKAEIKRLRGMLSGLGTVLQKLSADMAHGRANLMAYKASDFMDDLRQKLESSSSKPPIEWDVQVGDAMVDVRRPTSSFSRARAVGKCGAIQPEQTDKNQRENRRLQELFVKLCGNAGAI